MRRRMLPVLALLLLSLGLVACKSAEEKACANMFKVMSESDELKDMPDEVKKEMKLDDETKYVESCVSEAKKEKDKCKNYDDALSCMADAKKMEDLEKCEDKCE